MTDVVYLPRTKRQARAVGASHYYPGKPCRKAHHISPRVASSGACKECQRLRSAARYVENPAACIAATLASVAKRRDYYLRRGREYAARHRQENLTEHRARDREQHKLNAETRREKNRRWRKENPEKTIYYRHTRRAKKRASGGSFSIEDVRRIRSAQGDRCACCQHPLRGKGEIDHIVSIAAGGSSWPSNIQLLCRPCNSLKRHKDPISFMREMGRLL